MREISELDYYGEHHRRSWTLRSKQGPGSGIEVRGEESADPLDPLWLVVIDIYMWPFMSQRTCLVELVEEHFKSED